MFVFEKSKRNFLIFILLVFALLAFLFNITFDKLIIVDSVVRPETDIKPIQHLDGGIINSILVAEGDQVTEGQVLVDLVDLENKADAKSVELSLRTLSIENLRFKALIQGTDILLSETKFKDPALAEIVVEQKKAFFNDRARNKSELKAIEIDILERKAKQAEIEARLSNARESLKLIEEQIQINTDLEREKIVSRLEILKILREKSSLVSRIEEDQNILTGLKAQIQRLRNQKKYTKTKFYSDNQNKYDKNIKDILKLRESLLKANAKQSRSQIKSPIDGTVKRILINSSEEVVKPGQTLMEIIAANDELLGEGFLRPSDRGFVKKKMPVLVRISGPDGFKYSSIDGEVIFLSSDAVNVEGAGLTFKTRIKIKGRAFVNRLNRSRLELFPGMRISSAIKIGEQNLGEYLLKPITSQLHYIFSER
ncbi:MAG: HlyD family type I secretion periplasmic adaptor subunit [Pseudomonadota bacterium]|nr:HlyD family type I secretion periplasmic adaptor subunit [Pseudomonadota bacterium]